MVARNDVVWADLGGLAGRRPVCILTRDAALSVLTRVACAEITRTIRGIRSEVEVGSSEGLTSASVIACDRILTVRKGALDPKPIGRLGRAKRAELDQALRYALDIIY